MVGWVWLFAPLSLLAPRLMYAFSYFRDGSDVGAMQHSVLGGSKLTLRDSARRFRGCLSRDDVDLDEFANAARDFVAKVERFGEFTNRGVEDVRSNLRRVDEAKGRARARSMRQLLMDQVRRGERSPKGGPERRSGAEALLWSRLGLKFWVDCFKDYVRAPRGSARSSVRRTRTRSR